MLLHALRSRTAVGVRPSFSPFSNFAAARSRQFFRQVREQMTMATHEDGGEQGYSAFLPTGTAQINRMPMDNFKQLPRNEVTLIGFLGRDIELRTVKSGSTVGSTSLAVHAGLDAPTAWYRLSFWNDGALMAQSAVRKGSKVLVRGRIHLKSFQSQNGSQKDVVEVNVDEMHLIQRYAGS